MSKSTRHRDLTSKAIARHHEAVRAGDEIDQAAW